MSFEIESWHIASVVGVVIFAVIVYMMQKGRKEDEEIRDIKAKMTEKGAPGVVPATVSEPEGILDKVQEDEPEAPVLKTEDQKSDPRLVRVGGVEQEPMQFEPEHPQPERSGEQGELDLSATTVNQSLVPFGRTSPAIDPGVEAVCLLEPRIGRFFGVEKIRQIDRLIKDSSMAFALNVDYYDEKTKRWSSSYAHNISCSRIYLTMQLANRGRCINTIDASFFIRLAERLSIELDADSDAPDAEDMLAQAQKVQKVVKAFDKSLTVLLKASDVLTEEAIHAAALACGFAYSQGRFEKREVGMHDPLFILQRVDGKNNELHLVMDIPLAMPANDPLGMFFETSNDLCCRLDAVMCFTNGQPITSLGACQIAAQLKPFFADMARHGVAAGSRRSRRIFTRH
jgi:hypothetical protein